MAVSGLACQPGGLWLASEAACRHGRATPHTYGEAPPLQRRVVSRGVLGLASEAACRHGRATPHTYGEAPPLQRRVVSRGTPPIIPAGSADARLCHSARFTAGQACCPRPLTRRSAHGCHLAAPPIAGRHLIAGRWLAAAGDRLREPQPRPTATRSSASSPTPPRDEADAGRRRRPRPPIPGWRRTSRIHRAELFDNLAQLVKRETDALAQLMARECGKVVTECRAEVVEGLHMIQYVFGTGRMPIGDVLASEIAEKDAFMRRKPWGVVAVITPWNFPFAVPLWMLGPSLLEGNTAVFKPSRGHAGHRPAAGRAVRRGRLPAGRRSTSSTATARPARRWCANPGVNVVLFTGSYEVGQRIQQVSAEHPRPHRRRRDGQQERGHRLRGRPARPGGDGRHPQRVQDERPALRLGGPHPRARDR